jgi:hypothetical protein
MKNEKEKIIQVIHDIAFIISTGYLYTIICIKIKNERGNNKIIGSEIFYELVRQGIEELCILYYFKCIEGDKDSVDLKYLINLVDKSQTCFGNQTREAKDIAKRHQEMLQNDSAYVKHIRTMRDKTIAHRDRKWVNDPVSMYRSWHPDVEMLQLKFKELYDMVNEYLPLLSEPPLVHLWVEARSLDRDFDSPLLDS